MIYRIQLLATLAACMIFICACKKNNDETGTKTTISACNTASLEAVIGTQTWTTTNLNVDKFRNGDLIPEAKTDAEWLAAAVAGTPVWCNYFNSIDSSAKYGKLYNWHAVTDSRGLAPAGWHIPSNVDWSVLITYLGGETSAGKKMKTAYGWKPQYDNTTSGNGSNSSCFSGLPGGARKSHGSWGGNHFAGFWWSFTALNIEEALYVALDSYSDNVTRDEFSKGYGLSVRCLKD